MKKSIIALFLLIPFLVSAQDAGKKKAYYFYGDTCPHCVKVDEYFSENGIYDKYEITKLEFSNPFNARLLMKFGEAFDSEYKGSVPAIAFGDKFLVCDQPIIDNFEKEISNVEARELPDPEKNGKAAGKNMNQQNQPEQNPTGNKKNIFPVVLIALILVGGAALLYVNRKKA